MNGGYSGPAERDEHVGDADGLLAAVPAGQVSTAVAWTAIVSGRLVPANHWRALESLAVDERGLPEAMDLREAYEALHRTELTPATTLDEINQTKPIPDHDTVVRLPRRMAPLLLEVCRGGTSDV